jgi:hypothetical protein
MRDPMARVLLHSLGVFITSLMSTACCGVGAKLSTTSLSLHDPMQQLSLQQFNLSIEYAA